MLMLPAQHFRAAAAEHAHRRRQQARLAALLHGRPDSHWRQVADLRKAPHNAPVKRRPKYVAAPPASVNRALLFTSG